MVLFPVRPWARRVVFDPVLNPLHHPPRLEADFLPIIRLYRIPRHTELERRIELARVPRVHELETSRVLLAGLVALVVRLRGVIVEEIADVLGVGEGFGVKLFYGGVVVPVVATGASHERGNHGVVELFHQ